MMVFCIMVPAVRGQDIFDGPTEFIPLDVDRMYVKGMIWLVKNQKADGSFGAGTADHYGTQPGVVGLAVVGDPFSPKSTKSVSPFTSLA